jgi:hypothetical protein
MDDFRVEPELGSLLLDAGVAVLALLATVWANRNFLSRGESQTILALVPDARLTEDRAR